MRHLAVTALSLTLLLPATAHADVKSDLAAIEETFKSCTEADDTNTGMKQCAASARDEADALLNTTYKDFVSSLQESGDTETLSRLKAAQRAWITFRDAQCSLEAAQMLGGSGEGLLEISCLYEQTAARVKALDEQFNTDQ